MAFEKLQTKGSTAIASMSYDSDRELLRVTFADGVTSQGKVPWDVVEGVIQAGSLGTAFNRFIRGRFVLTEV